MELPLVSIIIPIFNSEKFISGAVESVQKQTYTNWEIILVDDCSTDNSVSIVSEMVENDRRIQFHQLDKNSGTGVARNFGLSKASGRYISFLDADDLWKPEKLKKQLDFLLKNNLPFTFSFYDWINEDGELLNKTIEAPKKLYYWQLFFCNYVGNLTGIYDANYFGKIEISSSRKRQDWMHWLSVVKKIKSAQAVPESLAYYRIRTNSISASKLDLLKHNFAVYRSFHGYNLGISLLCMSGFLFTQLLIKPLYCKNS
ncbi:glycosyltransferase family 2 protein [Flavobacterium sp. W1B]|uniref:glycosyltransferase family 2 protein n=1 Tax=Flavobacterium sp. W1B TaxID=3394146 RepID=UPI0039BCE637